MSNHDALNFLPRTRILDYPKGCIIYDHSRPPEYLYLSLMGRVKVYSTAENGVQSVLRVVPTEGFFGESVLLPRGEGMRESAAALESVQVMAWTGEQVIAQIEREPKLALALIEYFGKCNLVHRDRVLAFTGYKTGMRVAIGLNQLADNAGVRLDNGAMRLSGLTHQALGDYIGTTREIVTMEMNHLRRLGYLEYSRRFIDVHSMALAEWMREQGVDFGVRAAGATLRASG